ncbi:MAG: outer membrane lipoprotein LolB, partial [Glaciimonas sp.]|nr:outer membrane lipoprotein LolB [Glaciimonas sp.]
MTVLRSHPSLAIAALFLALFSAGCSTLPTPLEHASGVASTAIAPRPYYQAIDISGRLSVRYEQNGKEQAMHGSFTWAQTGELTVVTLLSPLGQTLATINITPTHATLQQAGQPLRSATNVDQLTTQALGWPLPIAGLRDWLQAFGTDNKEQRFNLNPNSDNST